MRRYRPNRYPGTAMRFPAIPLFLVIVLEGYVVLATELLAIRQSIPYVGSGTDTVSIIIAAVLLPLALGYSAGGRFRAGSPHHRPLRLRDKLIGNILVAMLFLLPGLSYPLLSAFFIGMINLGIDNRILLTTYYVLCFVVVPVYLLGQTVPLVSNYFGKKRLARITGTILFFSTLGSFLGAIFSTLVVMSLFGVNRAVALLFVLLASLVGILARRKLSRQSAAAFVLATIALAVNSETLQTKLKIVANTTYNTVMVTEKGDERRLYLNNDSSSLYTEQGGKHDYIEFLERVALQPLLAADPPRDILVLGAGGFTFGDTDLSNRYDFLDIDGSLQEVAETHLLRKKLSPNKRFHAMEARAWLARSDKRYDLILMDVFQGNLTIPEHLVTHEFFLEIKRHLKSGGVMAANIAASPNFAGTFSRRVDNTLRSVFPNLSRQMMYDRYQLYSDDHNEIGNAIYLYRHYPEEDGSAIYTDNANRVFYDRPINRSGHLPLAEQFHQ